MSSRNTDSLAASWRSQSQICRWISGSVLRRRSARGGKSPPRSPRAGSLLSLLPFLPHQEAVGQHHRHRVPVEASPPSALVLIPAQEPLGFLVVLLHPVPSMRVLHHRPQRHPRPEVAPGILPLAIGRLLPDQPDESATARRSSASSVLRRTGRAASPCFLPATSPCATTARAGRRSGRQPAV